MHCMHPTIFIIVLLSTINLIQAKPTQHPSLNTLQEHIKYLLNVIGVENEYIRFLTYMKIYPPEDVKMRAVYNDLFSHDSYISDLSSIYAKYYTLDDVIQLIDFYSSPLGKKTLQVGHDSHSQMEDIMLTKISDYIFTSTEQGVNIALPQIPH